MRHRLPFVFLVLAVRLYARQGADSTGDMRRILDRLDTLEKENRQLMEEVRSLRNELEAAHPAAPSVSGAPTPEIEDRVAVQERRTAEQAQTKVEAAHKYPIQLNGMLLFNAFANSQGAGNSNGYGLLTGPSRSGATLRQTLLGFDFQGPSLPGGGRIDGFLTMDFYSGPSGPGYNWLRLRRAGVSFDWANRSFFAGQDKPLISPYQPDSLAEVGIPPLAGAGNLWLWLPQARYEERIHLGARDGFTGQVAVLQTDESYQTLPASYANSLEQARPALEGRFAFWHKFDDTRRFELAPGFHVSSTHVAGASVGSHIGSLDWLIVPGAHLRFSGTVFKGQNVAGLGALNNGFTVSPLGLVRPVDSTGGWAQAAFPVTNRLTFNIYSGIEDDHHTPDMAGLSIVHNWLYASNFMYHLGPNVVVSLEALQMRTRSYSGLDAIHNHFDLAVGYLF